MSQSVLSSRFYREASERLLKAKILAGMQQDTTGADKPETPDKQDDMKETKDPKPAQVTRKLMTRQELWGRVKGRLPDIVRSATKESKPKIRDSESTQSSSPTTTDSKSVRQSSFSTRGKELLRKGLVKAKVKQEVKQNDEEKQKPPDPLEQWFVKHSGGTLRDKN
ncbi:hypothetical protein F5Y06DRAFT_137549 [Hypoxylon sp. FL0890]|nr:hypothetical protein F5Y06DRAFT_137549 [Hypoxylon sp. FL0890]